MYLLYSALLAIGLLLALPYWLWEMLRHGKYRTGFGERMGKVPIRLNDETGRTSIWITLEPAWKSAAAARSSSANSSAPRP